MSLLIYPFNYSCILSFIHSFVHPFPYLSVYLFTGGEADSRSSGGAEFSRASEWRLEGSFSASGHSSRVSLRNADDVRRSRHHLPS
ncbi:hypothetical protein E2C01_058705 [Portunus trituberculatus]|uniref:Uncharacterized protein n=1 Tax=Portunus trituberculatus TaxID=210409 RepID=A0A5B7H5G7_PORTR|nr:hypothetical protein [Portunus trituberculatus]